MGSSRSASGRAALRSQIVFSESWWVGTLEENPEERQLPLPTELSTTALHKDYDFAYGASYTGRQCAPCMLGAHLN